MRLMALVVLFAILWAYALAATRGACPGDDD